MTLESLSTRAAAFAFVTKESLLDLGWLLRRGILALGLPGLLGLAFFTGAAWIHWVKGPKLDGQLKVLSAEIEQLRLRPPPVVGQKKSPLATFRDQLETQARFSAVLEDLNTGLAAVSASLVEANVTTPTFKELPTIGRVDLVVYARGPYPALKSAIGNLLTRHPGLGLEQLTVEKNDAAGAVLDAHLRFVYYYRT